MKNRVFYGAIFSMPEIESLCSKTDVAAALFEDKYFSASNELRNRLIKTDSRLTYCERYYSDREQSIYCYGIEITKIRDDEKLGEVKALVAKALKKEFQKEIACSFYEIPQEEYDG